jgi:adenylate cyclase
VSENIGTILDRSEILEKIMDAIFEVFSQIDRGFIMLQDSESGELEPAVIRKKGAKEGEQVKVSVSKTIMQTAFEEKKSILSSDAMDDDRFSEGLSIVNFEIRSMMCSPLFVGEESLGVIHVDTMDQSQRFTPDDLSLLQGIGRQAAISIKNANLVDDIEEETQRRNSLQRFLSPDIAERVLTGEIDLKLGGDEKFGTVFFSDIIGFTQMSSILEPEVVVAKINRYFNIMVNIVFRYNGTINKFGGDSIMALWGLMAESIDHTPQIRSVQSCIDMHNALFDFNYSLIEEGQKPIQMGVGLNTGTFLAGNVGSERQMEFTVIGDTVNLASRIEAKAARGQIYVSASTYDRIKDNVYALKMGPTYVKGKEEPIQMYSIRGFLDTEYSNEEFDRLTIPVSYIDEHDKKHNGLLTGLSKKEGETLIFAHFRKQFEEQKVISLHLDLPEIADAGAIMATVGFLTAVNPEEGVQFYNYTLKLDECSDFFKTLMSREVIEATVPVDDIKRE